MVKVDVKVPKRRVYLETDMVERGKPHKRETQIMVGEFFLVKDKLRKMLVIVR